MLELKKSIKSNLNALFSLSQFYFIDSDNHIHKKLENINSELSFLIDDIIHSDIYKYSQKMQKVFKKYEKHFLIQNNNNNNNIICISPYADIYYRKCMIFQYYGLFDFYISFTNYNSSNHMMIIDNLYDNEYGVIILNYYKNFEEFKNEYMKHSDDIRRKFRLDNDIDPIKMIYDILTEFLSLD